MLTPPIKEMSLYINIMPPKHEAFDRDVIDLSYKAFTN